jgi:hypothetical protein
MQYVVRTGQTSMRTFRTVITSPVSYLAWATVVLGTLTWAYAADPYIFAFSIFGLTGMSIVVGIVGLAVALRSRQTSWRARAAIALCLGATAVALAAAFRILGTFTWA